MSLLNEKCIDEKVYCITWNKYRKFKNPKISNIFNETLAFSVIYNKNVNNSKCGI